MKKFRKQKAVIQENCFITQRKKHFNKKFKKAGNAKKTIFF